MHPPCCCAGHPRAPLPPLPSQIYVQDPIGAGVTVRPWKRLLAFAAVKGVAAGAQAAVGIDVLADDLAYYGDDLTLQAR